MRILIPLALTLLAFGTDALAAPRAALAEDSPASDSGSKPSTNPGTNPGAKTTSKVVTLQIQGMVTANCPVLVRAAVGKMDGVTRVEASLEKKTARVEYIAGRTTAAAIQKVIRDRVGFDSKVVR